MNKILNSKGFTLIELMLAMALFTTVLVITTVGFIGINRTFSKGLVRKQLSESVQRTTEDITRTLRAEGSLVSELSDNRVMGTTTCYQWGQNEGLIKGRSEAGVCNITEGTQLLDDRFKVDFIKVEEISANELYNISGVFRSKEEDAVRYEPKEADPDEAAAKNSYIANHDPSYIFCAGNTSQAGRTCALEKFQFTVKTTGVSP